MDTRKAVWAVFIFASKYSCMNINARPSVESSVEKWVNRASAFL